MKKILKTLILGSVLYLPFGVPVNAALIFCMPPSYPSTSASQQQFAECQKLLQESKEEQEKINEQYLKEQEEINKQNEIEEVKKQEEMENELLINELKDRIVQLQIQLLTLKLEQLQQQLKK